MCETVAHRPADTHVVCCKSIFFIVFSDGRMKLQWAWRRKGNLSALLLVCHQQTHKEWSSHVNINSAGARFMQTFCVCPSSQTEKHSGRERAKLGVGSIISKGWKVSSFPQICPVGTLLYPCWDKINQFPSISIAHAHLLNHSLTPPPTLICHITCTLLPPPKRNYTIIEPDPSPRVHFPPAPPPLTNNRFHAGGRGSFLHSQRNAQWSQVGDDYTGWS